MKAGRITDAKKAEQLAVPLSECFIIDAQSTGASGYYLTVKTGEDIEGVPILKETHFFGSVWKLKQHLKSRQ